MIIENESTSVGETIDLRIDSRRLSPDPSGNTIGPEYGI